VRPVVLLTDFGLADHYVGVVHAILVREAPGAERIDLGHDVPAGDVWAASFQLHCAWPHLPEHAVVLAVVDPGVGTDRRAVAARVGDRWLVAPDNGLAAAGGDPSVALALSTAAMGLPEPSATFHARDLFAPAAARLAAGAPADAMGTPLSPSMLVRCPLPEVRPCNDGWDATVLHVDHFGNVITNLPATDVTCARLDLGVHGRLRFVATYGDAKSDEVVALVGSSGHVELAVHRGSAAVALRLTRGSELTIRPHGGGHAR
jgi:S-adenosylmethionine hydrolase